MVDVNHYKGKSSYDDYTLVVNETHSDGMSTGLFSDEEDGYNIEQNLEETKYVLKGSAPSTDSSIAPTEEPFEEPMGDAPMDDLEGLEDAPAEDKPFDDEPFDAGVDADEDTDPAKYIQQLSGKLGQSLRQYSEDEGQPDFDLEKFAVNSVLSATHTGEMDKEDQRDIIKQVKGAGEEDKEDKEVDVEVDGDEDLDFSNDKPVEEIVEELPLSREELPLNRNESQIVQRIYDVIKQLKLYGEELNVDNIIMQSLATTGGSLGGEGKLISNILTKTNEGDEAMWNNKRSQAADSKFGKDDQFESYLQESKINRIFVDKAKLVKDLRLMENIEPMVEPQPITKPTTKPSKPLRETDRPFSPKRRVKVQPDPKAEDNDSITDEK